MRTVILAVLVLASAARADVPTFDESSVCKIEREEARDTAAVIAAVPDEAAELSRVDKECRDLRASRAKRSKVDEICKRSRSEAIARLANMRTAAKARVAASRDASARALAECVDQNRRDHDARVAADAADAAEKRREADEAAAKQARFEAFMNSKPTVRLALSTLVCATKIDRAAAMRAIADEKRYARIGGVQNNTKLYGLQQEVRDADQQTARFNGELKKRKTTAIKCGDAKVKRIVACLALPTGDASCVADEVAGPIEVMGAIGLGALD